MKKQRGKARNYKVRGGISPRDAKNKMKKGRKRKMGKAREIKFPQYNK